jgi:putative flippase GtrA
MRIAVKVHHSVKKLLGKFMTFGMVGAIGTLVHYTILIVLVETWAIHPGAATTLGFGLGALVNYLLNHRYTFKETLKYSAPYRKGASEIISRSPPPFSGAPEPCRSS